MNADPTDPIRDLLDRLRTYLDKHPTLREHVAIVGRVLTVIAEGVAPVATSAEPPAPVPAAAASPVSTQQPIAEPVPVPQPRIPEPPVPITSLPPLTFKQPAPVAHVASGWEVAQQPLPLNAARCRLKVEASRFVARKLSTPGTDDWAAYGELTRQAKELDDCYLWMLDTTAYSDRPAVWNDLAEAYAAAAAAADMLQVWRELPDADAMPRASETLHLAAEAQAVLFAAVAMTEKPKADNDQINLFVTIREEAASRSVYVSRYLRREDRADPSSGAAVARRITELVGALRQLGGKTKTRQKALKNLKHKLQRIEADPNVAAEEWTRTFELIGELIATGLQPSNVELREMLLPVVDVIPTAPEPPEPVRRVLREIDRYLTLQAETDAQEANAPHELPSAELAAAAELLRGKEAILIGGLCRPDAKAALEEGLGLAELHWRSTEEHESIGMFEAPIARPEVAIVLLAIRWSSHSYGDVQAFCERYGKLLVRLPGGYHPNQVAHQIMAQVGDRLRAAG